MSFGVICQVGYRINFASSERKDLERENIGQNGGFFFCFFYIFAIFIILQWKIEFLSYGSGSYRKKCKPPAFIKPYLFEFDDFLTLFSVGNMRRSETCKNRDFMSERKPAFHGLGLLLFGKIQMVSSFLRYRRYRKSSKSVKNSFFNVG